MKYTAKIEHFSSELSYIETMTFNVDSLDELELLLMKFATPTQETLLKENLSSLDNKFETNNASEQPKEFGDSGGFCSRLLSFVDDNGNDLRDLKLSAFGEESTVEGFF